MGIFSAIGSAVRAVGGWLGRNLGGVGRVAGAAAQTAGKLADGVWQSKLAKKDRQMDWRKLKAQREWALEDAAKNRQVARRWRNNDRAYAEVQRGDERRYQERWRGNERAFSKEWRDSERAYSERIAARNLRQAKAITTEQREYDRGTLSRLRDDAIAAGFNPLTALGETRGAIGASTMVNPAFSSAYGAEGPQMSPMGFAMPGSGGPPMNSEWQPVALPALASPAFVGEALAAGVETWFNREQLARDEEAHALQTALMREELTQIQRENSLPAGGAFAYSIPQTVGSGPTTSGRTAELSGPALPSNLAWEADPVVTEPFLVQTEVSPNQRPYWVPNAEDLGELVIKGGSIIGQAGYRAARALGRQANPKRRTYESLGNPMGW